MSTSLAAVAFTLATVLAATEAVSQPPRAPVGDGAQQESTDRPEVPPRAIRLTKPKYPKKAFAARLEGTVEVQFLIDAKGRVANTRLIHSVPGLDEAAIECVREWLFEPAPKGGKAVATFARAPVTFRIYSKAEEVTAGADLLLQDLVTLERAALDRWVTLDPAGYLDLYAPEISYFDATTETRVDGRQAMEQRLAPLKNLKLPFTEPRYEMIAPRVQRLGDAALLTFNLANYGRLAGQPETTLARWNATEIYSRIDGRWRIVHSHWSFVKPELKPPGP